jgi:predicted RNA-binding Zn ribbon-like protein
MTGYIVVAKSLTYKTIFSGYNCVVNSAQPKPFQLYAGHPAPELVNTLDMRFTPDPIELLPGYADLLRFTTQLGLITADRARKLLRAVPDKNAQRVLASTVELREALAQVFYLRISGGKLPAAQMEILERHFHAAAGQRSLRSGTEHLEWSWAGAEQQAELPLWKLAQAASDLLLSTDADLVKDCGAPTCRWLFLDVSKNRTRRWCDMKTCGNRMKARRHQARLHEASL